MNYRQLGDSELMVSEISLGSWLTYGVGVDRENSEACVRRAFDEGINFFDTANVYGRGAAESFMGEALKDVNRSSYLLATKLFFPMSDTDKGLSREQVHKQISETISHSSLIRIDRIRSTVSHELLEEYMDAPSSQRISQTQYPLNLPQRLARVQ